MYKPQALKIHVSREFSCEKEKGKKTGVFLRKVN